MIDILLAAVSITTAIVYGIVLIAVERRNSAERKDLYDRLMSSDLAQYKAQINASKAQLEHIDSAHQKAIERFEHYGIDYSGK